MPYKNYVDDLAHAKRYYRIHRRKILGHRGACNRYYSKNKQQISGNQREFNLAVKRETFNHYGDGTCACCGESNIKFLTLDHVKGKGREHRAKCGTLGGWVFYKWLKKHNWPKRPKLQVLCFNCNCGRNCNRGICPHKD